MIFLPVSVNITWKKILIIGVGKVVYHKAAALSRFTAEATVISPEFQEDFGRLPFTQIRKAYERKDLEGAFLVYICTENEALNARIKSDAQASGILASVCYNPLSCDFISPAICRDGYMTIAVSSGGRDVRCSTAVRNRIRDLAQNGTLSLHGNEHDTVQVH